MTIDLEKARQLLLESVDPCAAERISLENSWGRLLAENVTADIDFPPFDRSPLDGYAVRSSDVANASPQQPVVLQQIDYIPAGSVAQHTIGHGQAARIMTGAAIPPGADGIVRLEDVVQDGMTIYVRKGVDAHKNIRRQGEEIGKGEMILQQGMLIDAGSIGVLAMLGKHAHLVYMRPRVGVLVSGSELIEVSEQLVPGKIRNSNAYMILSRIKEAGGEPVLLGKVQDDTEEIVANLRKAPACDMIITTGGASAGDYDLMGKVFAELSVPILFDRVAIKPGMPVLAGRWKDILLLALSGSPAGASVAFEVLVRPLIRKMAGDRCFWRPMVKAVLKDGFCKTSGQRRFVWAQYHWREHGCEVWPLFHQSNNVSKSMLHANALIDIPPDSLPLAPGDTVNVLLVKL